MKKGLIAIVAVLVLGATAVVWDMRGRPIEVDVDGGASDVAVLGDIVIAVRPGQTVILRHAGDTISGAESPITHAFAGPSAPPPVFTPTGGGLVPTPAVWGPCQGGAAEEIVGACPIPAAEGPKSWDGLAYWSTGAMVPSETREITLADEIAEGEHILTCALHPDLRVVLSVDGENSPEPDTDAVVDAARAAVEDEAEGSDVTVTAGLSVEGAYVVAFSPQTVSIPIGGSVTWRAGASTPVDVVFGAVSGADDANPLSLAHTVPTDGVPTGDAGAWDGKSDLRSGFLSADLATGASAQEWTVTFTRPGTYTYASRFGDAMIGTVVVERAGS